ncbi:MAG TPA: lamin tail domain-containing protein, partial [Tepidisphaeraceae bacterium]|nr:lamin tail domain-containing protein [Tepidisphaeraceae bacterium]
MDHWQSQKRSWQTRNKLKKAAAQIHLGIQHGLEALEARQLLAADVIISEIMFHPSSGDTGQEYLELFNKGDATADLTNWKFDKGIAYTFTGGALDPGQYLVVAADLAKFTAKYPGVSNVVGGWTGTLSNGGEQIQLSDNLGATVDQVTYADDGNWGVRERGRGVDLVGDITSSADVATVDLFDHGYTNGDTVQIFGADQPEYNGTFVISSVTNTSFSYTMASAPAGSAATGFILSRRLIDRGNSGWSWVSYADGLGNSLELINPALSNNDGQNWGASSILQGTPGSANSIASANVAPLITSLQQTPLIPKSTETVNIFAELKDENPASITATLRWRVDSSSGGSFNSVAMHDDGLNGDALAGDGIWTGAIPAQANGAVVEYYISASDGVNSRTYSAPALIPAVASLDRAGNVVTGTTTLRHGMLPGDTITITGASSGFNGAFVIATVPDAFTFTFNQTAANATAANTGALRAQSANRLYQVDNTLNTSSQILFKLIMRNSERVTLDALQHNGTLSGTNASMNGTLIASGPDGTEGRFNIGIRNRGGGSRTVGGSTAPNYHIDLQDDHTWSGVSALNFNGSFSMEDVTGSAVMRAAGLPVQNVIPVQVRVNNVNLAVASPDTFGSYSWLESEDSDMVATHFPLDKDGNYYRAVDPGHGATLAYNHGTDASGYLHLYHLQTNTESPDYTDILNLLRAFDATETPNANFVAAMNANINVAEWMRYLAASILIGDQETTLASGIGDDFDLYRGAIDQRFVVVPHDLDQILGVGGGTSTYDGIFQSANLAAMSRLLRNSTFAPMYAAAMKDLIDTTFAPQNIGALLDNTLGSYVPQATITAMKTFAANRITAILSPASGNPLVPLQLRVTSTPALVNGYPQVVANTAALSGQANAITTRSVLVNGVAATWTAGIVGASINTTTSMGGWSATVNGLRPGINRVLIQSLDGTGKELERTYQDIWYDTGAQTNVSGALAAGTTTWTPAGGPYHVTASITVNAGSTLVIQPGTTVFFEPATQLLINGGTLNAQGTDLARIRLTRTPGSTNWNGIRFTNTLLDNRLAYLDEEYAVVGSEAIFASASRFSADHVAWLNTTGQILDLSSSTFRVTNSIFPTVGAVETVHYLGTIPAGGEALFQGNIFGGNAGFNDEIDFTGGQRPGPILQLIDNVFMGPYEDDILDLDGTDAHIEGNVFMNAHLTNPGNADTSSAVSGGLDSTRNSHWTVVRNFFYDLDHANLTKEGAFLTFVNNTVVNLRVAAINFDEPLRAGIVPGQGAYLDGNIFYNVPQLFENVNSDGTLTQLTVNRSIVPAGAPTFPGVGVSTMDPSLLNTVGVLSPRAELILRPGPGPAVGAGPNGMDMGAAIPEGATIGGVPLSPSRSNSATLTVGGPDIYGYKYRIDGGAFSAERQIAKLGATIARVGTTATITLNAHGYVNGNTVTISSAIQPEYNGTFVISGVTTNTFNITVASTAVTPATGQIVVQRPEPIILSGLSNGTHTIEVVRRTSANVWQADALATKKTWTVNTALPAPTIRINEVLAQNSAVANHSGTFPDIIELFNAGASSIDLSGMSLTDDPANPTKYVFPPGTPLLAAGAYLVVYADNPNVTGGIHTGFSLKQSGEGVYLYNTLANGGGQIDGVTFGYQLDDLSISRQPDGSWRLSNPTFGAGPNFPGALNTALPLGDPHQLKINEWGAHGVPPFSQDFIELYNPIALPMDLGGLSLSDQPIGWPDKSVIPALTFIGSKGYFHFKADNDPEQGADHLDFRLSSERGDIGLYDAAGKQIDFIVYGTQQLGLSQGRTPDGGPLWQFFAPPNPGVANPAPAPISTTSVPLIGLNDTWRYNQSQTDLGTEWREPGYIDNIAGWLSGGAVLGNDADPPASPIVTTLDLGLAGARTPTFYFRIHFNLAADPSTVLSLQLETLLDDGAIIYLNGHQIRSIGMPSGTITFNTYTGTTNGGRNVDNAVFEGPFTITDLTSLVQGDNILQVEVHQTANNSGDIMWGARLNAIVQGAVTPPPNLRVTEINYNPPGGGTTYAPSDFEFIELKNTGATPITLTGIHFGAGVTFNFSSGTLAAGATGVLVKNQAAFTSRYGSGINILGQYTDSLDNNGEEIRLLDAVNNTIQDFAYSDAWYPTTDGSGPTLTIIDPTADFTTWISPDSWRASKFAFGSPGTTTENAAAVDSVVVNEISSNSAPGSDWIELYNPTASPISIGGWYLTDSAENLLKYRIPAGTTIQPGQYLSFDESQFNTASPVAFTLSEYGEDVWLSSSTTAGILTGYHQGLSFGPAENAVTFGRYTTSTGQVDFPPLSAPTRDAANAYPKIGPIVINEIMYHPATTEGEFIELRNITGAPISLDNWKFLDGLEFTIPVGTSIPASGFLLLVDQDPNTFRSTYNVPAAVQIFQYVGALDNAGENLALGKPGPADPGTGFIPFYLVDRVNYAATPPWPITPDGQGPSLARLNALNYGNDPINWTPGPTSGTPGRLNFGGGDAVVDGSAGDDTYYIRLNGANMEVFAGSTPTGQPAYTFSADSPSFTFNGNAGNDKLIVDFSNGAPLTSGNIIFAGGAQTTSDSLTVIGGTGANNTGSYTPTAATAGTGIVSVGGHAINFSGLEPVLAQSFATFTFTTPSANDSLTLDSPAAGQTRISGSSAGAAFESISFTNVANFILDAAANDAGAGNDAVTINNGTSATGLASLQIKLGAGANTINHFGGASFLDVSTTGAGTSTVNVSNSSTVNFTASQRLTSLNVNNTATARLAAGGTKFLRVTNFTVATGAALDLTDNDLIIQSTAPNKATLYSTIFGYLFTGRAGGLWNGRRINSSTAAANTSRNTGLAAIVNDIGNGVTTVRSTLAGEPVDVNTILVKYSYNGDGNLDGALNADDYAQIDAGFASHSTGYFNGDFNYTGGQPNSDDYFLIDRAYSSQSGPLTAPDPTPQP